MSTAPVVSARAPAAAGPTLSPGTLWALGGLFALSLARFHLSTVIPLFGDEAFYWLEGRYPAWAYSDLPPLTAWLTRAGSELLGMSYAGVRWLFLLCWLAVPLLVGALARTGGASPRVALLAGVLCFGLPVHGVVAPFALPEAPLNLLWLLSAWLAALIVCRGNRWYWWLGLGLCLGLGLLTHYRFAPLLAGLAGLFLLHSTGRARLRSPWPWLAALLPLAALWPQLEFNLAQEFAAVSFQLVERHPWQPQLAGLKLPLVDLLLLTPVLAWLLISATRRQWRTRSNAFAGVLLWAGAFPVAVYWLASPLVDTERVSFHWTLAGWLTLCAGLPAVMTDLSGRLRGRTVGLIVALGVLPGLVFSSAVLAYWRDAAQRPDHRPASADYLPDNLIGWPQIAERLAALQASTGAARIVADNFMLAAELSFELGQTVASLDHPLNHKHGRATQLSIWGLDRPFPNAEPTLVAVEITALGLVERTAWSRQLCRVMGGGRIIEELVLFGGRKRVLVWLTTPEASAPCDQPAFWYIDEPARGSRQVGEITVRGWALETAAGVERVEIWLDDEVAAVAQFGLPRPGVGVFFAATDAPDHPNTGFSARFPITPAMAGRRRLRLLIHERDGGIRESDPRWVELATQ